MNIRQMSICNLDFVLNLIAHEGWSSTRRDFEELLNFNPKGYFIGEIDGLPLEELEPTRMLIMNVDGKESIGVFLPGDESSQPWSLHIRSRLVVLIQWQVVKTVLSSVEAIIQNHMS